jgi:hypothetical protein
MHPGAYGMTPSRAGSKNHNNKSSLLLSFKKEDSSFLKNRSKGFLFSRADSNRAKRSISAG